MRRVVEIFIKLTGATGQEHPRLQTAIRNYARLLQEMGRSQKKIRAQLNAMGRPYGRHFGDEAKSGGKPTFLTPS